MTRIDMRAALIAITALAAAGCGSETGPQRVPAYGTVRLGSVPLPTGQIRFIPVDGTTGPAAATRIVDGAYSFTAADGPIVGTQRIEIEATDYLGFEIDDERAFASFAAAGHSRDRRRTENPVPPQYNVRSSLTRVVDRDTEPQFDFELQAASAAAHNHSPSP